MNDTFLTISIWSDLWPMFWKWRYFVQCELQKFRIYIYFKKGIEIKFVLVECWSFFKAFFKWLCGFWSNYRVTFHSVRTYSGPSDPIGCHIEIKLSLGKCQIKLASVLLEDFIFLYILANWLVIVNVIWEESTQGNISLHFHKLSLQSYWFK